MRILSAVTVLILSGALHAACEENATPGGIIAAGTEDGQVAVFDKCDPNRPIAQFRPFGERSLVNVAVADVNGDHELDIIVAAGPGGGPHVRVFSGQGAPQQELTPYPGFTGGVFVAAGDINGDGVDEIITAPGASSTPHDFGVRVFNGSTGQFLLEIPLVDSSTGGVHVAAGDVNGDGFDDIITGAGAGGGPHVRVFDGRATLISEFFAYPSGFTGGVRVATADINNDGIPDIITGPGPGGGPNVGGHVKVFDGITHAELASFFAFDPDFRGGIFVAGASDGGGAVTVTPGAAGTGIATIRIFFSDAEVQWLMPFRGYKGGLTVAVSPGDMSNTPQRSRLPGGLKITQTWP